MESRSPNDDKRFKKPFERKMGNPSRPMRKKFKQKERFDEGEALYKLIKTTKGNVIIRRTGQDQGSKSKDFVAVLRGTDQQLLRGREIENVGLCFTLSRRLLATKYVGNTFQVAVEEARALLGES